MGKIRKKALAAAVLALIMAFVTPLAACGSETPLLKDVYKKYFKMGVALGEHSQSYYRDLIPHFNSMTPENDMKFEMLQPTRGNFTYEKADALVAQAKKDGMEIRAHGFAWYRRTPDWVFQNAENPAIPATKDEVLETLREHIRNVAEHFKGQVYAWDVVNEVISDSVTGGGEGIYRLKYDGGKDSWYEFTGKDFIKEAFITAHEVDPGAKLFYNDYSLNTPDKRERALTMLKWLIDEGVPIHGVGMQAHYNLLSFNIEDFEDSIKAFAELGLEVHISELDISIYPWDYTIVNYGKIMPEEIETAQAIMYRKIFEVLRRHKGKVTSVSFWGVADDITWLDNDPIPDRKNWPLIFDVNHEPKAAYYEIINFKK